MKSEDLLRLQPRSLAATTLADDCDDANDGRRCFFEGALAESSEFRRQHGNGANVSVMLAYLMGGPL
jgi:hypothetical protein